MTQSKTTSPLKWPVLLCHQYIVNWMPVKSDHYHYTVVYQSYPVRYFRVLFLAVLVMNHGIWLFCQSLVDFTLSANAFKMSLVFVNKFVSRQTCFCYTVYHFDPHQFRILAPVCTPHLDIRWLMVFHYVSIFIHTLQLFMYHISHIDTTRVYMQ